MNNRDIVRLKHMVLCCENIITFTNGKKRTQLMTNHLLDCAVRHQLQVLGEAANSLSHKTKETLPNIPWKQIIGLRNKLIHEYFDINYEIIWTTVKVELPILLINLKNYLSTVQ